MKLETFIASVTKQHFRKFGMEDWDNSTVPVRFILLTEKQALLYNSLLRQRINEIERLQNWDDGTFKLSKDGAGIASLLHKSGMCFDWVKPVINKSFAITNKRTNKAVWIANKNHAFLKVKHYKKQVA